ncbi:MAG: peptidoglycan-binding protein, partial [Clostridia bacterium]
MKDLKEKRTNPGNAKNREKIAKGKNGREKSKLERWALPLIGVAVVAIVAVPLTAMAVRNTLGEGAEKLVPTPTAIVSAMVSPSPEAVLSPTDPSGLAFAEDQNLEDGFLNPLKATMDPALAMPVDPNFKELSYDMDDVLVATIQERFMELGFMDNDEPTEHFGAITREAVESFQRQHKLEVTGIITAETYSLLMSEYAQRYVVGLGMSGADVENLQYRLYQMAYLNAKPTGYYGTDTENAVKLFQERNNIALTGIIDDIMRQLLFSDEAVPNIWTPGSTGAGIAVYQQKLFDLGYLTAAPNGVYGEGTIAAVKRFQEINALIVDGFLGPDTIDKLMSESAIPNALVLGMSGTDVQNVQNRLGELKYLNADMLTGYFGTVTEYAVRIFQKTNGLDIDGRVGKYTMTSLFSENAKAAPSDYNPRPDSTPKPTKQPKPTGGGSNTPKPDPTDDQSGSPSVSRLIDIAESKLGSRYRTGGKGPDVFDCSGFVFYCLNRAGINQPYMTSYQWRSCSRYRRINDIDDIRAGDVIVFYGHVGLIVSDNEMI